MNFMGSLTAALEAVGEVIAPLPDTEEESERVSEGVSNEHHESDKEKSEWHSEGVSEQHLLHPHDQHNQPDNFHQPQPQHQQHQHQQQQGHFDNHHQQQQQEQHQQQQQQPQQQQHYQQEHQHQQEHQQHQHHQHQHQHHQHHQWDPGHSQPIYTPHAQQQLQQQQQALHPHPHPHHQVSQQQRDYPESELTLVEESQKVTTVVSVQPENIEAKSVPHIHESVTRIAAMEERIQSLQNQNEVIDSKLKASLEQQYFLENQIREKDNDIKALTNEVATQKKKCKSAFSEVEALSDDLRSTLQSSTALKIRIDEEVSARKAVESQMSELKELHDRNSAPLSPPPPPPPSPPHKEVNEDLVLSTSSFEALRSIITQLQRGDKGEFDGDLVTTADELVMSLRVSLDTEMQQFDDMKSKSQELGNDVQNLKEKLQECETQRSANEDEFRVKLEEMVRTNEDHQNLMGKEISDHKKKVDSLTSEQVTAANEVIALQIKIKSLEDEKKALAVSAKESIRNLDTTSTPIISPLQLSELKQQNQKLETETKQLHQIIKQLRQAVKPVSGDKNEVQSRNIQLAMEKQAQELKQEHEKKSNAAKQEFEAEVDLLKRNHEGETSRLYNKLTELQSLCSKEVKDHEETAKKLILVQEQFELFRKSQHDVSSPVHVQNGSVNTTVHQEAELASLQVMVETREYENKALAEKLAQCQQQIIALEDSEKTDQQDVMIKQLEGDVAVLREQLQACQDERQAVNQKLSALQTSDKSSGQALTELKAQNQKLETESRQLHQVIAQLRQARRSNQENAESAIADRESQQNIIDQQTKELTILRELKAKYSASESKSDAMSSELEMLRSSVEMSKSSYETTIMELKSQLEDTKRQYAQVEVQKYEVESQLEASVSDVMIIRHDLSLRNQELENLHKALNNLEKEYENKMRVIKNENQSKIDLIEQEWLSKSNDEKEFLAQDIEFYKKKVEEVEEKCQDEILMRRKLEMDISAEKRKLNHTLEIALNKLQHSQEDTVDRTLVKNLVVTYFRQRRSIEVLGLIAKILGFTDDDKVIAGLQVSDASIVSSFFQTILSPLASGSTIITPKKTVDIEGDNLAEMWQSFLMQESDIDTEETVVGSTLNSHVAEINNKSGGSPRNVARGQK